MIIPSYKVTDVGERYDDILIEVSSDSLNDIFIQQCADSLYLTAEQAYELIAVLVALLPTDEEVAE